MSDGDSLEMESRGHTKRNAGEESLVEALCRGELNEEEEEEEEQETLVVVHHVRKYETLAGVALAHDVSVCALKAANNLMCDSIYHGQVLRIPLKRASETAKTGKTEKQLKMGSDPCLSASSGDQDTDQLMEHIVKKTDTISSIALRYGMRTSELKEVNELRSNHLKAGSVLQVYDRPLPCKGDESFSRRRSLTSTEKTAKGSTRSRVNSSSFVEEQEWPTPEKESRTRRERGGEQKGTGQDARRRIKSLTPNSSPVRGKGNPSFSTSSSSSSTSSSNSVFSPKVSASDEGERAKKAKKKKAGGLFSVFGGGTTTPSPKKSLREKAATSVRGHTAASRLQSLRIGTVPHVACPGETLESIADVYSMRVTDLRELNQLVTDQLYPGQLLYVKTGNVPSQSPYQARRKRSLSTSIASDAAGVGKRREEGFQEYTVVTSDTLSGIALAHNMTVARLKAVNGMYGGAKIYKGLKLLVDQPRSSMCSPTRSGSGPLSCISPLPTDGTKQKDTPRTALNRSLRNRSLHDSFLSVPSDMKLPANLVHSIPCRFLVKNAPKGIRGTCTMTPHRVIFEPDSSDDFVGKYGSMACQLELEIGEVTAPLLLTKSELAAILSGTEIAASAAKSGSILQISRLADANDDLSDIAATYNLLVDREHGEHSYKVLLDYLCNYSMLLAQERDRMEQEEAAAFLKVPSLRNKSTIFEEDISLAQIASYLPHRLQQCSWALAFASDKHGISLSTFYQRLCDEQYSLLFVEDHNGEVFGGFASAPWQVQEGYFGSGESFVFQYRPTVAVHTWQAEATSKAQFLLAHRTHIEFGGGSCPSLWLGEDFNDGATGTSETFRNPPLCSSRDFKCTALEVWVLRPPL